MSSQVNRYYKYVNDYSHNNNSRSVASAVGSIASGVASVGSAIYGIYSDLRNQKRADEASDWQKLQDVFNNNFAVNQFSEGVRQYDQNYEMEKRAMDLTQSNFENEAQIRTADLQKAGLNPLNYSSAGGQTVSFSGGNNVAGSSSASSLGTNQVGTIGAALLMEAAKMKFEQKERAKDRRTQENIAKTAASASMYNADTAANASMYGSNIQSQTAAEALAQRKVEFVQNFGLAMRTQNEKERAAKIAEVLRHAEIDESTARRKAESLAKSEDIRLAYEKLALAEKELAQAKTSKEAEIAAQNKRTWLIFISNMIDTAVDGALSFVGKSSSKKSNPIGFTAN